MTGIVAGGGSLRTSSQESCGDFCAAYGQTLRVGDRTGKSRCVDLSDGSRDSNQQNREQHSERNPP
jgi:hypothetical protein